MVRITRQMDFSASLRLARGDWSPEENARHYGAGARQHGHNYRLEVTLRGEPDPLTGMVMDLKELQDILDREVGARFDHRDLNADTPYFEKVPPTPEHLVLVIRDLLVEALPAGMLDRVRLQPDERTWVEIVEAGEAA